MKATKIYRNSIFVLLVLLLSIPAMAFEPAKKPVAGSIHLKNGEVLTGMVSPLGEFSQAGTVFRADKQSKKSIIPHQQIDKVVIGDRVLVASVVPVGENNIPAYLDTQSKGSAVLYRAHYYAPKQQGKNNSVTQLQWSWILQTASSGLVNLGHQPTPSQLASYLQHPLLPSDTHFSHQDEQSLVEAVEQYNMAVRSVLTGIPNEELKQDR